MDKIMFLNNKYTNWYYSIINQAMNQKRKKGMGIYYELHHIIPKCMDGSNKKDNLILLTPKEHFICHLLLCRMIDKKSEYHYKLCYAVLYFKGKNNKSGKKYTSSFLYNCARTEALEWRRKNYDKDKDIVRRNKISESMKIENARRDKTKFSTDEWKEIARSNGIKAHHPGRIYKYKNNPEAVRLKKKPIYSKCLIEKNGVVKEIKINQVSQYSKFGWKRMVVLTGFEPAYPSYLE